MTEPAATAEPPEAFRDVVDHWRPGPQVDEDLFGAWPTRALAAVLDAPAPADALPPLWHEVYLRAAHRPSDLGADGHPLRDDLVPDLANRRRMFGGGRVAVTAPLRLGETVRRTSTVESVTIRHGRSGWLLLVTERHRFTVDGELRVTDERDIVYRLPQDVSRRPTYTAPRPTADADLGEPVLTYHPDERMLFQFSALTYNAHRIHYDFPFTTAVEGHPHLLVHGPLLALGGLEAARRTLGHPAVAVDYRLVAPAYCGDPVTFHVTPVDADEVSVQAMQRGRCCLTMTASTAARRPTESEG
ncbi:hypothetical protein G4X40_07030 [Rhodococcus sp. D2-41]|uniref:hypothetical protein n=1 Tax=Speluncibacter jeojiensis TaxID=2710754 RepID=UPI0024108D38|nr:hypothetical protein [Rhodococcus sp. D2-41]MDG3009899.1 hypothetical protein [Rhodococcus sp. D2-41]